MGMLKDLKNTIAFLTRLPVGKANFNFVDISGKMWMFPIIGFIIGMIVGIICQFLFRFLPSLLVGFIALSLLIYITGAHHTDGLLDFGDGLMASGTPERKIEVMHDVATGTGGIVLGLSVLILTGLSISYTPSIILVTLVTAEAGAKFSMVVACATGKSAGTKLADPFIENTTIVHLFIALLLSFSLVYITLVLGMLWKWTFSWWDGMYALFYEYGSISPFNFGHVLTIIMAFLLGSLIPALIINRIANRNFRGLTGDCLGALNEISRVFILVLLIIAQSGLQLL